MLDKDQIQKIKTTTEEFFAKTTINVLSVDITVASEESEKGDGDVVNLDIKLGEPQILIGQGGQTLFEIQRLLRMILNKKINASTGEGKTFYLNLDINDYKKNKIEYLESLAKAFADEVVVIKEEKHFHQCPLTKEELYTLDCLKEKTFLQKAKAKEQKDIL